MKKRIMKKIKKALVRQAIVQKSYLENECVVYEVKLIRFWHWIKDIKVLINNKVLLSVDTSNFKREIYIHVPLKELKDLKKVSISLLINGKKMWIKNSFEIDSGTDWFIHNNDFYTDKINKDIVLYKTRYQRIEKNVFTLQTVNNLREEILIQNSNQRPSFLNAMPNEVYVLRNGRFRKVILNITEKNGKFYLLDFNLIQAFNGYLFLREKNVFYPINSTDEQYKELCTDKHIIQLQEEKGIIKFNVKQHMLTCQDIEVQHIRNAKVRLSFKFNDLPKAQSYQLLMTDNNNDEALYELELTDKTLSGFISENELVKEYNNKKFLIIVNKEIPYVFGLHLKSKKIDGNASSFDKKVTGENLAVRFYRRKDKQFGLSIRRPKLIKVIDELDDFVLKGYIDGLESFNAVNHFLVIEERDTNEKIYINLTETFEIDLNKYLEELLSKKGRDKCVFDLYLEIVHTDEVIRKEKIKYPAGIYKKDNYFERKVLVDKLDNKHYFLLTITPYNNLKIETFIIPENALILEDTSVKNENIWLVGERYNTAQDNGIVFFKWLQRNTPISAYYVIEKDSPDYKLIKDEKNILTFGSDKHYEIATKAKVLLGTHDLENLLPYKQARGFFHYEDTIKVFLQHGVLGRKNVEYHKEYYETPFDLFIVSSAPEKYDVVIDKLGYEEKDVVVTGLARFDNLIQKKPPKDILIMPTWRDWLNTEERFQSSQYFMYYKNLLENEELNQVLNDYDININFYPHYRSRKYFDEALDLKASNVRLVPFEDKSVQELLIESALLVTDYSSVSFDFVYLNKPVIYYQFDAKRFFRSGILRPLEDTSLGMIGTSEEEIVHFIIDRIKNNFENYEVDTTSVLAHQDEYNCQRTYKAVVNKINETRAH